MFDNARWLRLIKRELLVIDGQDYTEETWVGAGPKGPVVKERVPRQRYYSGR